MCRGVFPAVTSALQLLRDRGIPMALVTGKGPVSTALSLRYFSLDGAFGNQFAVGVDVHRHVTTFPISEAGGSLLSMRNSARRA